MLRAMAITSLAHACIKTTDLSRTEAFYCGGLGMEKTFNFTRRGEIIGFYMKAANNTFVEVFLDSAIEHTDRRCLNHFCLETDDLEGLRSRLIERGWEPEPIKMGADQTAQFWMKDPNGLAVEFQQYTEDSAQRTGRHVEVNW
ncbi:MAG TPA: VOC family protein [Chthoniobacteraceae bacterium]|jgi:catechol 2,3-dioxygenase-like lactoylglutathione lyase family enzyme|nr:VOC family protein [Chthoniobacteraceae bacterium]